jgi:hypothetical protein
MPAAFAPLVFPDGSCALYCPATGRPVSPELPQSPHLRFVVDWIGGIWAVDPAQLPEEQAAYQRTLIELFNDDDETFENQNALIAACVNVMPDSALVLEMLHPPQGSFAGEIAYFGFDLALCEDDSLPQSVMLLPVEDLGDWDGDQHAEESQ